MGDQRTTPPIRLAVLALAVLSLASACGGDVVVDEATDGTGGAGASASSNGSGAATSTSAATGTGAAATTGTTSASGGSSTGDVGCGSGPVHPCDDCAKAYCAAELGACCMQDDSAAAEGKLGCWDVVACGFANGCTGQTCIEMCERQILQAGVAVAARLAQPVGDCVFAAADAGLCPSCF
jgi:hypothetical protein